MRNLSKQPRHKRVSAHVNPQQEIIDEVLLTTFQHEQERLAENLTSLITQNQSLGGTMNAFVADGRTYATVPLAQLRREKIQVQEIHPSLYDRFTLWKTSSTTLEKDLQFIRNALSTITGRCKHAQDFRDVLPEPIVSHIKQFQGVERHREEGWLLKEVPHMKEQFDKAVQKILFYQANRLIFD